MGLEITNPCGLHGTNVVTRHHKVKEPPAARDETRPRVYPLGGPAFELPDAARFLAEIRASLAAAARAGLRFEPGPTIARSLTALLAAT